MVEDLFFSSNYLNKWLSAMAKPKMIPKRFDIRWHHNIYNNV